jgi:zinc protease
MVCALTLLAGPVVLEAQPRAAASRIRRDTLDNGMTVIVVENHSVALATAHIVFRGGAMTQTEELEGVPHLFEHMLFKSYRGGPGETRFDDDAAISRASYNGATGDETVSYTMWLPSDHLGEVLQMMATLVREPRFIDKDLQPERFVVRNEMQRRQSDPEFLMSTALEQGLWGSWYPRKNTIGNDMALFAVNQSRLTELYRTWYVPNNAALVVTGDVQAEKVLGEARKHFGRWKRGADPFVANPVPKPPPMDSSQIFVFTREVQTVTVEMAWRGPDLRSDSVGTLDAAAFEEVMNADDSPMQRGLVDGGVWQSASFSAESYRNAGALRFRGVTTPDKLLIALGLLGSELGKLAVEEYYDPAALSAAARRRQVGDVLQREESASYANTLGSVWAISGLDAFFRSNDVLATRTPTTLAAFAGRYITRRPYVLGVLTPEGTQQAASQQLAQFIAFMREP